MISGLREDMNIVVVGHVDHGKSTIVGRLFADTNSIPKGKLESVKEKCKRNSKPFEYSFLLDALKEEQSQGITIDSARCFFKTKKRRYMIIDTPGHLEFLKNMVTGASRAEAALLVIDAFEGVKENSKRHGYILSMLGIKQIAVLVNKMDLVNYDRSVYRKTVEEYSEFLRQININDFVFIPVSGRTGDNIAIKSENMDWYTGGSIIEILDCFKKEEIPVNKPFRMPVQDVYKFTAYGDTRRIVVGTVESGRLNVGDEVTFYPSAKKSFVKTIEEYNGKGKEFLTVGEAASFTLTDHLYIKRGELAVKSVEILPNITSQVLVNLFWLGKKPMEKNKEYYLKIGTAKVKTKLLNIVNVLDAVTLQKTSKEFIETNDVAECILTLNQEIAFDLASENISTGRFVIVDDYEISGGGIIAAAHKKDCVIKSSNHNKFSQKPAERDVVWQNGKVTYEDRCHMFQQRGLVIWFTGLSGAGKSTIAIEVEKALLKKNKAVYRLDGDNIRQGLNNDLGFTKEDRNENIRRMAEVALLFKDAAFITLVSAITPYNTMRDFAKERIGQDNFIEIYVKADIDECIRRDPKGFYAKAKHGSISGYTGIDDPYEEPPNPDVILDTIRYSVDECCDMVLELIDKKWNSFKSF